MKYPGKEIFMADNRKKASMSQVLTDIKPYITKKFMATPCVKEQDIPGYLSNSSTQIQECTAYAGLTNNKPDFRIQVKRFVQDRRETV